MKVEKRSLGIPTAVQLEDISCPLGCSQGDDFIVSGTDRLHNLPGVFNIVKCRGCGLVRTNPRPTSDTIGFYYPANYGPYRNTIDHQEGIVKSRLLRRFCLKANRVLFPTHTKDIPDLEPGHMLEIGCASGSYLHQMARKGWRVTGIELSAQAATIAREAGYSVHIGPIETSPESNILYDLIVGWMVLEHLHDPIFALKRLSKWIKPSGWLVLSVPNIGSLEFRIFKSAWYNLHLPAHLFFFDKSTIGYILDTCGWALERVIHQRNVSTMVASLGYAIEDAFGKFSVTNFLTRFPSRNLLWHMPLYPLSILFGIIGEGGRMTIWARKK
jgi:2-polyprenyl-3-methyl-5-hydroxy-6-metoxy-1,4-benzoquinol methylase